MNMDCILVGHKDVNLQNTMSILAPQKTQFRGHGDIAYRVIWFRGKWWSYMDLLNLILTETTGQEHQFNVSELPNLGLHYLKSYLTRRNFIVEIINYFNSEKNKLAILLQNNPQATVAISTTYYLNSSPIREIIDFIRKYNPKAKIIAGGPYIYSMYLNLDIPAQEREFDAMGANIYVCDSQGEKTLAHILQLLKKHSDPNFHDVPNLVYRNRDISMEFVRTQREVEANSLDKNMIDWGCFPKESYTPTVFVRTARSCSFKCAFCRYPVTAGPLTLVSLDLLEKEMQQIHKAGVKNIIFIDDTFNVPLQRFKKILRMMINNQFNFNWASFFRCATADDLTFDLMKESGCIATFLGIESGDTTILKNMNKCATINRYKYGIQQLNQRGIMTIASFVVGFPGETKETIQNTINFIEESQPDYYSLYRWYYDTNVPIHQQRDKYALRGKGDRWEHNTMDWKEANDMILSMFTTIKNSTYRSSYRFGFTAIPYLMGKGISLEHIREFLKLCKPLFMKNFIYDEEDEETYYRPLLALGKEIALNLK